MKPRARQQVVMNVENDRLVAVIANVSASRIDVADTLAVTKPEDVDATDATAVGAWVQRSLKKAGMLSTARRGVLWAVPRGDVVLKRLSFPAGVSDRELPGMVGLQMSRQLTMTSADTSIDYVRIPTGSGDVIDTSENGQTSVLVGALQADRLNFRRDVARAARLKIRRIGLKSSGSAALLAEVSQRESGATLGVSLGSGSVELVVVADGRMVFARATDLVPPEAGADSIEFASGIAVEAKRTWMSYRVAADSVAIDSVTVLGRDDLAEEVANRCGEALDLPSRAAGYPGFVVMPERLSDNDATAAFAPLIGVLAEEMHEGPLLDFEHPRKPPDLAAHRRQRVLAASLLLIILPGGAYTYANLVISRKETRKSMLEDRLRELMPEYEAVQRDHARLEHITRIVDDGVQWLDHLSFLSERLPEPTEMLLDQVRGSGAVTVDFDLGSRKKYYQEGTWATYPGASFRLVGTMKARETADQFRTRLAEDERYRLETRGPEQPNRFDWTLRTGHAVPPPDEEEAIENDETPPAAATDTESEGSP